MTSYYNKTVKNYIIYAFVHKFIKKLEEIDTSQFKYMYIGYTNDFDRRMKEHLSHSLNLKYKRSQKFYNRLRSHGWENYDRIILEYDLTHEEAKIREIDLIQKYNTFELGLNSTPGGDGCGIGVNNPMAKAVNLYNNTSGEIISFMCMRDADRYLGVDYGNVKMVANPNTANEQLYSMKHEAWFQVKHACDISPFDDNMTTPYEKTAEKNRTKIIIHNIVTRNDIEFDGIGIAARKLGIGDRNIGSVISGISNYFTVSQGDYVGMYDAQYFPKEREWKSEMFTRHQACEKPVVAYDENNFPVFYFDSATKASKETGIHKGSISQCAKHDRNFAGLINGHELRWEFQDINAFNYYEYIRPRKSYKLFYINGDGKEVGFKTITEAAKQTCGNLAIGTQQNAISKSIKSIGSIACNSGYLWFYK